jgi:hypothetical protein
MHVDLIEPSDRRWRDTLAMIRHDFYHLPEYVSLKSNRLGGTAVAAYVEQRHEELLQRERVAFLRYPRDSTEAWVKHGSSGSHHHGA